ncbi:MAG: type II toxin-antitoxin system YafQ family toxin [Muribaculaceae bacterium]|nr:type II toxin-antitoxin system YafQ family toxin [Muribaculaceae bacterium]
MYRIIRSNTFKKSFKRCLKRGLDIKRFEKVIEILSHKGTLPLEYRPHRLSGKFNHVWECHISSDWLLTWELDNDALILILLDTGTHSDIFG